MKTNYLNLEMTSQNDVCNQIQPEEFMELLTDEEIMAQVLESDSVSDSVMEYLTAKITETKVFNDFITADLFAYYISENVKYIAELEKWAVFNGKVWDLENDDGFLTQKYGKFISFISSLDADENKIALFLDKAGALKTLKAIKPMLKDYKIIKVSVKDFNKDDDIIICQNGIYDLNDSKFYPKHSKKILSTVILNASYNPNAKCDNFDKLFEDVVPTDKAEYLKTVLGSALSGKNIDQSFWKWRGYGANGKTTLQEAIINTLGTYSGIISSEIFKNRTDITKKEDFFNIWGKRLSFVSEMNNEDRLGDKIVKLYCGSDTINVKSTRNATFPFKVKSKFILVTNHTPQIMSGGFALERRLKEFCFSKYIPENKQNKELGLILAQEKDGILNRLIEWYNLWKSNTVKTPDFREFNSGYYKKLPSIVQKLFSIILTPSDIKDFVTTPELSTICRNYASQNGLSIERVDLFNMLLGKYLDDIALKTGKFDKTKCFHGIKIADEETLLKIRLLFSRPMSNAFLRYKNIYTHQTPVQFLENSFNQEKYKQYVVDFCEEYIEENPDDTESIELYEKIKIEVAEFLKNKEN